MNDARYRFQHAWIFLILFAFVQFAGCVPSQPTQRAGAGGVNKSDLERGVASYRSGDYESALASFSEALKRDPDQGGTRTWLGWTHLRLKQYDEGMVQFALSNTIQESGFNHWGLGEIQALKHDYARALASYEQALALGQDFSGVYEGLGNCLCALGRHEEADAAFSKAVQRTVSEANTGAGPKFSPAATRLLLEQKVRMAWVKCCLSRGDHAKASGILGPKPFLGIAIQASPEGVEVNDVWKGSPAEKAGLRPGDILIRFDGRALQGVSPEQFIREILGSTAVGTRVPVTVKRQGGVIESVVQNGIVPDAAQASVAPRAESPRPTGHVQKRGVSWAVIVGISTYGDSQIPPLRYAAADARAFHDWIVSPDGGRYAPANVKLLIDHEATARNIKAALFEWLKGALEEDMVVIYFAGHGSPESPDSPGNLYLLAHDTQYDSLATTGFPMWDIETALKRFIRSKRVVVMADACHSGGVGQAFDVARRSSRGISVNPISSGIQSLSQTGDGICVISASGEDQFSQESQAWGGGHGVFTYFLIQGLQGNADYNQDRSVSLGELTSYLSEQVRRETKNAQSPTVAGRYDPSLTIGH